MIPTDVSGSRLPVGSSASRSGGWLTNGAGDRDALLLAARELVGVGVQLRGQPRQAQDVGDLRADVLARVARDLQRVGDVVVHGAVGQELEVLEHHAEVAAVVRAPCGG
jgi:hypothetical protein